MQDRPQQLDDPDKAVRLNFDLRLSPSQDQLVDHIVAHCLRHHGLVDASPVRVKAPLAKAISVLLANLKRARASSRHCYVALSLNKNEYTPDRYRQHGVTYTSLLRAVEYLRDCRPALITYVGGFYDRRVGIGRLTRIRATYEMVNILRGFNRPIIKEQHIDVTNWNALKSVIDQFQDPETDEEAISVATQIVRSVPTSDCIRLRGSDKGQGFIDYPDTDETKRMRGFLDRHNEFISNQNHIDLYIKDDEFDGVLSRRAVEGDKPFDEAPEASSGIVDLSRTRLHRVFNNGSFDHGGRFYGGWWQNVPNHYRRYITINQVPTREVDFSNLHAAMLYAMEGLPLEEDAYSLPGFDNEQGRKLVKATFFKLVNALEGQRIRPPRKDALPAGMTWKDLQEALRAKHSPIAKYFNTGIGLTLQKTDAKICERILSGFTLVAQLPVLPVHDSFITYIGSTEKLKGAMKFAYGKVMKAEIGVDVDDNFLDIEVKREADDNVDDLLLLDVRDGQPGFARYHERWNSFLRTRNENWMEWHFGDRRLQW